MGNISFENAQFELMTRVLKADLIEKCIKTILNGKTVTIDSVVHKELLSFVLWLLDNA